MSIDDAINRALALHQPSALDATEQNYRAILKTNPDQSQARHLVGVVVHQRGETAKGAALIKSASVLAPEQAISLGNLSTLLIALTDATGVTAARRAMILAPGFMDGMINLAIARLHRGAVNEAIKDLQNLVDQAPTKST